MEEKEIGCEQGCNGAGWIGVNHKTSASPKYRERRLNISEPNPPIGRGSTSRVGIDFQSYGGLVLRAADAHPARLLPATVCLGPPFPL